MDRQNQFHEEPKRSFGEYGEAEGYPEIENPEYDVDLVKISRRAEADAGSILDNYENGFDEEEAHEGYKQKAPARALNKESRDEQRRKAKSFSRFEKGNLPRIYNDIRFYLPKFLKNADGTKTNISEISLKDPAPMSTVNRLHNNEKISWWHFLSETVRWCFPKVSFNPIMYADIVIEEVIKPLYYCEDPAEAKNCINFRRLKEKIIKKMKTEGLTA